MLVVWVEKSYLSDGMEDIVESKRLKIDVFTKEPEIWWAAIDSLKYGGFIK